MLRRCIEAAQAALAAKRGNFATMGRTARNAIVATGATCAGLAVLINVLFMQSGHHPAPLFGTSTKASKAAPLLEQVPIPPLRRANADATRITPPLAARTPGEIITAMHREVLRRGYYDGPVDGFY